MGWQIVMIGIGLVGCSLIVTIDSWLDLASNPGFCTTLALAQTGPGNNTSVPQIYNLTTVIQFDRNIFGSIVAFGLEPAACGLWPAACGLRPTAYGLRPSASLIKICWAYRHGYIGGSNSLWPLIHLSRKKHFGIETVRACAGPGARSWPEARVILGQRPISRPPHPARFAPLRGMRGSRDRPLA